MPSAELFSIIWKILGGLALFLFSISMLSNTLKKIASFRLKNILKTATNSPVSGAFTGAIVTFFVQSSSITVLLLLGLVNSGVMNLRQAVFVILGSEIGTTITAQIVSFKVKMFFFPLIVIGFGLRFLSKKERLKNTGDIIFSFGMIFLAMALMADGSKPLKDFPLFLDVITKFGVYPILGILIGALFTAITNSSSATTSLIIAMSMEGVIDLRAGIALMIGANIGTCFLELFASVGTSIATRRTGMAQFMMNMFGAALFYPFLVPFSNLVTMTAAELPRHLANAHTIFNVTVSLVLMPFVGLIIYVLKKIIPGEDVKIAEETDKLDEKLLKVPALALSEAEEEVNRMASIAQDMLLLAKSAFFENDDSASRTVRDNEEVIDKLDEKIGNYLNRVKTIGLSKKDRLKKRALTHSITDIERVADLAENLVEYAGQKEIPFSEGAREDLRIFFDKATETYSCAVQALKANDKSLANDAVKMEDEVDELEIKLRKDHMERIEKGLAKAELDGLFSAVLRDLERIGDHSDNIAGHVISM